MVFRIHLGKLLNQIEQHPFPRLTFREGEVNKVRIQPELSFAWAAGKVLMGRRTLLASVNWLKARKRYVLARRVMSGALNSGTLVLRSPTSPSVVHRVLQLPAHSITERAEAISGDQLPRGTRPARSKATSPSGRTGSARDASCERVLRCSTRSRSNATASSNEMISGRLERNLYMGSGLSFMLLEE